MDKPMQAKYFVLSGHCQLHRVVNCLHQFDPSTFYSGLYRCYYEITITVLGCNCTFVLKKANQ